uniref:Uncharacterized protein n=1 Tax=Nelumbo nucifera TaxID=4432 RepID=A0A822YC89_NELNU|nr:TPA_asm: hypothetical protein HUJ06_030599 [Nelumbo nucifera]
MATSEGNDFELLFQILKDFLLSCQTVSSISYFNLAKGLSKATDFVLLLNFIREVSEVAFPRSAMIIHKIIYGFDEDKHNFSLISQEEKFSLISKQDFERS